MVDLGSAVVLRRRDHYTFGSRLVVLRVLPDSNYQLLSSQISPKTGYPVYIQLIQTLDIRISGFGH